METPIPEREHAVCGVEEPQIPRRKAAPSVEVQDQVKDDKDPIVPPSNFNC